MCFAGVNQCALHVPFECARPYHMPAPPQHTQQMHAPQNTHSHTTHVHGHLAHVALDVLHRPVLLEPLCVDRVHVTPPRPRQQRLAAGLAGVERERRLVEILVVLLKSRREVALVVVAADAAEPELGLCN